MNFAVHFLMLSLMIAATAQAEPRSEWEAWRKEQEKSAKTEPNTPFTLLSIKRLPKGSTVYFPESARSRVWTSNQPKDTYQFAVHWKEASHLSLAVPGAAEQTIEFGKSVRHQNFLIDSSSPKNEAVGMYVHDIQRNTFRGFTFFPYSNRFRVEAKLERGEAKALQLLAGRDRLVDAFHIGKVKFSVAGQTAELQVYTFNNPRAKSLFIPFSDTTTDKETYGAGRYLEPELKEVTDNSLVLDFNYAHNPYCAYHADYSCILVPADNRLGFAVTAGEKKYHR